jgi:hypothetical protein
MNDGAQAEGNNMDYLQTAKQLIAELPKKCTCTSLHGVDKADAIQLRVRLGREAQKAGYTVFTKLRGRELTCWRVE